MNHPQTGFLIGIGSNIKPEQNISLIIQALMTRFSKMTMSSIVKIPPIGMTSQHEFLNLVVFIETLLSEHDLKQHCNTIEIELGRDRTDPDRKMKDRPADLDILASVTYPHDSSRSLTSITDEFFLYPLIDEITDFITHKKPIELDNTHRLSVNGLTLGQAATTIYSNTHSCYKRVI
jgi:2-amino-4-hydroxy-6-hydroxymethyldihydropteridine diphosphokinase